MATFVHGGDNEFSAAGASARHRGKCKSEMECLLCHWKFYEKFHCISNGYWWLQLAGKFILSAQSRNKDHQFFCKFFHHQKIVFPTLCDVIVQCTNFKVRINGATALAVPTQRQYYGPYFVQIWTAMLAALQQANHLTDFNEYNHRDKLLDQVGSMLNTAETLCCLILILDLQLCISLSHLIQNCTVDDIVELENTLMPYIDTTTQNWSRVINRMVPEKAVSLLATNLHLRELQKRANIPKEQIRALETLSLCFVSVTEYDE